MLFGLFERTNIKLGTFAKLQQQINQFIQSSWPDRMEYSALSFALLQLFAATIVSASPRTNVNTAGTTVGPGYTRKSGKRV